jgi:hypothetical protein
MLLNPLSQISRGAYTDWINSLQPPPTNENVHFFFIGPLFSHQSPQMIIPEFLLIFKRIQTQKT